MLSMLYSCAVVGLDGAFVTAFAAARPILAVGCMLQALEPIRPALFRPIHRASRGSPHAL